MSIYVLLYLKLLCKLILGQFCAAIREMSYDIAELASSWDMERILYFCSRTLLEQLQPEEIARTSPIEYADCRKHNLPNRDPMCLPSATRKLVS